MKLVLLIVTLALASIANAEEWTDDQWNVMAAMATNLAAGVMKRDQNAVSNVIRELVKNQADGSMPFIGFDNQEKTIKVGVLSYWDGIVHSFSTNPYWETFHSSQHLMTKDHVPTGLVFVEGPNNIKLENSKISVLRTMRKAADGAVKVFTVGKGQVAITEENSEKCDKLSKNIKSIDQALDNVDASGIIVLTDELYCPTLLLKHYNSFQKINLGTTYTKDGYTVDYVENMRKFKDWDDNKAVEKPKTDKTTIEETKTEKPTSPQNTQSVPEKSAPSEQDFQ